MPIRVLIVDDHRVIRTGLKAVLASDPEVAVVGEAGDGSEACRLAGELKPDIVMLDIGMPGEDGLHVAKRLRHAFPQTRVLFLTMHEEAGLLAEAIESGAAGYVIKRAEEAEILEAVHAVHRGDLYIHPAMTRTLMERQRGAGGRRPANEDPLTPREVTVLLLLIRGFSSRQIGEELGLPMRTVESYRASVRAKVGIATRVGLAAYAERHNLV